MSKEIHLIPGKSTPVRAGVDTDWQIVNHRVMGGDCNTCILAREPVKQTASLIPDFDTTWYEFIPENVQHPAPMVISRHGGMDTGMWQAHLTSWCHVAEREGFIVVFPNADWEHRPLGENSWPWMEMKYNADPEFSFVREMLALIEHMKSRFDIDAERIFMQGHSVGDMLTLDFAQTAGRVLAGIAETTGPISPRQLIHEDGTLAPHTSPVPTVISFCENNDMMIPPEEHFANPLDGKELTNLRFWRTINNANGLPRIGFRGDDISIYYPGEHADVLFHEVWGRAHSIPFDEAEMLWSTFFSAMRRLPDGTILRGRPDEERVDKNAAAVADGCVWAYVDNQPVRMDAPAYKVVIPFEAPRDPRLAGLTVSAAKEQTDGFEDVLYVPVTFLRHMGVKVELAQEGRVAYLTAPNGDTLEIAEGNIGAVWNGRMRAMYRQAEYSDGMLFAPLKWLAGVWLNRFVAEHSGVMYVSDCFGRMTPDMAALIRELLSGL